MAEIIHKSLVGSRAHGLHNDDSDYDYRGIYVLPTEKILSLGFNYKGTSWIDGDVDNTSYEIGHFLLLATKANPSVLEVITRDSNVYVSPYSTQLMDLLPKLYDPKDAYNAFTGYSLNQRKKMLDDKEGRRLKFAVAYIRTLYNLIQLFSRGYFVLTHSDDEKRVLTDIKKDKFSNGDIINLAESLVVKAKEMLPDVQNHKDLNAVNRFLINVRKDFFHP